MSAHERIRDAALVLADGSTINVRPIDPGDGEALCVTPDGSRIAGFAFQRQAKALRPLLCAGLQMRRQGLHANAHVGLYFSHCGSSIDWGGRICSAVGSTRAGNGRYPGKR